MEKEYVRKWKLFAGSSIIFIATYMATYRWGEIPNSDIYFHTEWAMTEVSNIFDFISNVLSYPLWHYTVRALYVVFGFAEDMAAALATAIYNTLTFIAVDYFVRKKFSEICDEAGNYMLLILALFFVGPLYYPHFNVHYYEGQWSPNPWHNPTNITVRLFTVLALTIIGTIVEDSVKICHYILLAVILFLSTLAKPSFLQGIVPGLGLYMLINVLIRRDKSLLVKYIKLIVPFIPSAMYMVCQLFLTITSNKSNPQIQSDIMEIGFGWGGRDAYMDNEHGDFFPVGICISNHCICI